MKTAKLRQLSSARVPLRESFHSSSSQISISINAIVIRLWRNGRRMNPTLKTSSNGERLPWDPLRELEPFLYHYLRLDSSIVPFPDSWRFPSTSLSASFDDFCDCESAHPRRQQRQKWKKPVTELSCDCNRWMRKARWISNVPPHSSASNCVHLRPFKIWQNLSGLKWYVILSGA